MRDITDTVGVRVITYFNDDVDKIAKVIEREFEVDRENSIDKRVTDPDRFGYSSLHYVVNFNADRVKFIEYKDFKEVKFEIQIRSILQHAWAEIEHDLGYKSKNEVPKEIRRDFSRIAGLLEIADNEFMRIKNFLDNYSRVMGTKIRDLDLNVPIDKVTLMEYVATSQVVKEILIKMCSAIGIDHSR
ncbi:GTP pyrophosphokinase, partial [Sporosarcina koreensis]